MQSQFGLKNFFFRILLLNSKPQKNVCLKEEGGLANSEKKASFNNCIVVTLSERIV